MPGQDGSGETMDQDAIAAFVPSHFATQNQMKMGASFANIVTDMMGREASFAMMPMPQGIGSTYTLPGVAAVIPSHCSQMPRNFFPEPLPPISRSSNINADVNTQGGTSGLEQDASGAQPEDFMDHRQRHYTHARSHSMPMFSSSLDFHARFSDATSTIANPSTAFLSQNLPASYLAPQVDNSVAAAHTQASYPAEDPNAGFQNPYVPPNIYGASHGIMPDQTIGTSAFMPPLNLTARYQAESMLPITQSINTGAAVASRHPVQAGNQHVDSQTLIH